MTNGSPPTALQPSQSEVEPIPSIVELALTTVGLSLTTIKASVLTVKLSDFRKALPDFRKTLSDSWKTLSVFRKKLSDSRKKLFNPVNQPAFVTTKLISTANKLSLMALEPCLTVATPCRDSVKVSPSACATPPAARSVDVSIAASPAAASAVRSSRHRPRPADSRDGSTPSAGGQ